jgi:putative hydrolase of the HAD superfamily
VDIPNALLLDIDNTIYPYEICHTAALRTAGEVAKDIDPLWIDSDQFINDYAQARHSVKSLIGPQAAQHCRLLYFKTMVETRCGHTNTKATQALHDAYWKGYFTCMKPSVGCQEFLRLAKTKGLRLAWVTDFTTERQMLKLSALGLEDIADFLVTSEEVGKEKPNPAMLEIALKKLGVRPEKAWMIGDDHERDIRAAKALGITAIWFHSACEPMSLSQADFVVQDWTELMTLFSNYMKPDHASII